MANAVRNLVSKKKRRYQTDGFDLDLAYITPQLIAMGYPSQGLEGLYRNPLGQVQRFMNEKHNQRFRIYNLCCERAYAASHFDGNVRVFGFKDHNAPPFALLTRCILDMEEWLSADAQRVAAVHCKAGKGRTGVVICCYLVLSDMRYRQAEAAMKYYGDQRTHNSKGITIPSQRRYCHYFARALAANCLSKAPVRRLGLKRITIHNIPEKHAKDVRLKISGFDISGDSIKKDKLLYKHAQLAHGNVDNKIVIDFPTPFWLEEDFDLSFKHYHKDKSFMHLWVHTGFVEGDSYTLTKPEIDGPHKDKKHAVYAQDFTVQLDFEVPQDTVPPIPSISQEADLSSIRRPLPAGVAELMGQDSRGYNQSFGFSFNLPPEGGPPPVLTMAPKSTVIGAPYAPMCSLPPSNLPTLNSSAPPTPTLSLSLAAPPPAPPAPYVPLSADNRPRIAPPTYLMPFGAQIGPPTLGPPQIQPAYQGYTRRDDEASDSSDDDSYDQ